MPPKTKSRISGYDVQEWQAHLWKDAGFDEPDYEESHVRFCCLISWLIQNATTLDDVADAILANKEIPPLKMEKSL